MDQLLMDTSTILKPADLDWLKSTFGSSLQANANLARFTSARVGGPADALLIIDSVAGLTGAVRGLWAEGLPFLVIGGGSNILVSDLGVRGVVIVNQARQSVFKDDQPQNAPQVWAESGANLGALARQAAVRGFSGLEWAAGIPGTLGGAVVGNAGAHGGDIAANMIQAEILPKEVGVETWKVERFEFTYRSSGLKELLSGGLPGAGLKNGVLNQPGAVVLSATLRLSPGTPESVQARMDELVAFRRRTQPPGASMGSMFKNPAGDYAGRLIEAAGLKGLRIGNAEISQLHGNFFINHGNAQAVDILALMYQARQAVSEKYGVILELEVQLIGEW